MNDTKPRPPLDVLIIDRFKVFAQESNGEFSVGANFESNLASETGYPPDTIEARINYFIDEGVVKLRKNGQGSLRLLTFVDLDKHAEKLDVQCFFGPSIRSKK